MGVKYETNTSMALVLAAEPCGLACDGIHKGAEGWRPL